MKVKNVLDNISSFLIDPNNNKRNVPTKVGAWITTVIVGVLTVGIAQGASAVWRKLRHVEKNDTHDQIRQLFKKAVPKKDEDSSSSGSSSESKPKGAIPDRAPHPGNTRHSSTSSTSTNTVDIPVPQAPPLVDTPLQEVAKNVYAKRDTLWKEAAQESNGDNKQAMLSFINKIRGEFKDQNLSLSEIVNDREALNTLFQSTRLRIAIVNYARVNNLDNLLDKHLVFLAQNIYDNRESLYAKALEESKGHPIKQLMFLTDFVRDGLKSEGRSLSEIVNNEECLEIFKKSNSLMLMLAFYVKMKSPKKRAPLSPEEERRQMDNQQLREALALAKKDAAGPGVVTRIGLQDLKLDEAQLLKGVNQFLLKNHPDRNQDADEERVRDATAILDMIKNGVFKNYREALDSFRK